MWTFWIISIILLDGITSEEVITLNRKGRISDCSRCLNGGTCVRLDGYPSYQCICLNNFEGDHCEKRSQTKDACQHLKGVCANSGTCISDGNSPSGYHCQCKHPWTGQNCNTLSEDACESRGNICGDFGSCQDLPGHNYKCICHYGYIGLRCEYKDPCLGNSQLCNGSRCIADDQGNYRCLCNDGFNGPNCHDIDECRLAEESNEVACENNGTCVNTIGSYKCECKANYYGEKCQERQLNCDRISCENGGTCLEEGDSFKCVCDRGYTGKFCEEEINECQDKPCLNGGQCEDLVGSYQCHCPDKYYGANCETRKKPCDSISCLNEATCRNVDDERFECICAPGFEGALCEVDIDNCKNVNCENGGACIDYPNDFKCLCEHGFTGRFCEISSPLCANIEKDPYFIGECFLDWNKNPESCMRNSDCGNGGFCYKETSKSSQGFCHCPRGWNGNFCERQAFQICDHLRCHNRGHCQVEERQIFNSLHTNDVYVTQNITCTCESGFGGLNCEDKINPCADYNCSNGGECIFSPEEGIAKCSCPSSFSGLHCEETVHICQRPGENPCANQAKCQSILNGPDDHVCLCEKNFSGKNCTERISFCANNVCEKSSSCIERNDSYECYPFDGNWLATTFDSFHEASGLLLIESFYENDHCYRCKNGAECILKDDGGFACSCDKIRRNFTGEFCEIDINECLSDPEICNNGKCVNTHGSYYCECKSGYRGANCEERINVCGVKNAILNPCRNGGICNNHPEGNTFSCTCPEGFTGTFCEHDIDECDHVACKNGGQCIDSVGGFTCQCPEGYAGKYCQIDELQERKSVCKENFPYSGICAINFDDCRIPGNVCHNNGTCHDGINDYLCECPIGYAGNKCEYFVNYCKYSQHGVNEYLASNKVHHLTNNPTNSSRYGPCDENGTIACDSHGASFKCLCKPGYIGQYCNMKVDKCKENEVTCENGGKCLTRYSHEMGSHIATCQCRDNYFGDRCEHYQRICREDSCLNGGKCIGQPIGIQSVNSSLVKINKNFSEFLCHCPDGIGGEVCNEDIKDECLTNSCANGGLCYDALGSYKCICNDHHCGKNCELTGAQCTNQRLIEQWIGPKYESNLCTKSNCESKMNNNFCDPECDLIMCNYDNNSCLFKLDSIFNMSDVYRQDLIEDVISYHDCKALEVHGFPCHLTFNDGKCQDECGTEECLFDGWDCSRATNSTCDNCENTVDNDWVILSIDMKYEDLKRQIVLKDMRKFDDFNIFLKIERELNLKVYDVKIDENHIIRKKRHLLQEPASNLVRFKLNNSNCNKESYNCLTSSKKAAEFLTTVMRRYRQDYQNLGPLSKINYIKILKSDGVNSIIAPNQLGNKEMIQLTKFSDLTWKRVITYLLVIFACFGLLLILLTVLYSISNKGYETSNANGNILRFFGSNGSLKLRKIIKSKKTWFPIPQTQIDDTQPSVYYPHVQPFSPHFASRQICLSTNEPIHSFPQQTALVGSVYSKKEQVDEEKSYKGIKYIVDNANRPTRITYLYGHMAKYPTWKRSLEPQIKSEDYDYNHGAENHKRSKLANDLDMKRLIVENLTSITCQRENPQMAELVEKADRDFKELLNSITQTAISHVINSREEETGETLMHIAVRHNRYKCLQIMIDLGGCLIQQTNDGRTPLLLAVSSGSFDCVAVIMVYTLMKKDLNPFSPGSEESALTPLIQAIICGEIDIANLILDTMLEQSANIISQETANKSLTTTFSQDSKGFPQSTTNSTLSHSETVPYAEEPLNDFIDINATDLTGRTALHWAAVTDQIDILKRLLASGANIDAASSYEETPLILAAKEGLYAICKELLTEGANVDHIDQVDQNARLYAENNGYSQITDLIDQYKKEPGAFRRQNREWPIDVKNAMSSYYNVRKYSQIETKGKTMKKPNSIKPKAPICPQTSGAIVNPPNGYVHTLMNSSDSDSPGHWSSSSPSGCSPNGPVHCISQKMQTRNFQGYYEPRQSVSDRHFGLSCGRGQVMQQKQQMQGSFMQGSELTLCTESSLGEII